MATARVLWPTDRRAPIGCLAKLLTASLATAAARRGLIAFDAEVNEWLDAHGALRGVTIRHLLEHRHGLDDSLLAAPRRARGFIDGAELLARVGALDRWASPGVGYSYGHSGAWLLATLLERLHGLPFAKLVRAELFARAGVSGPFAGADVEICPALGTGVALTAEELVRVALYAVADHATFAAAPPTPLPGWHPLERGVCLGWKCAGAGWLGHQSVWPNASAFLRVHRERKLALAVVASAQPASLVALGVFGEHYPELFDGRARLPRHAGAPLLPGVYAQAARVVAITSTAGGLAAEACERDAQGAPRGARANATLVAVGSVHFAKPATEVMPYLEAVPGEDGAVWLWNGRAVLRREAARSAESTR